MVGQVPTYAFYYECESSCSMALSDLRCFSATLAMTNSFRTKKRVVGIRHLLFKILSRIKPARWFTRAELNVLITDLKTLATAEFGGSESRCLSKVKRRRQMRDRSYSVFALRQDATGELGGNLRTQQDDPACLLPVLNAHGSLHGSNHQWRLPSPRVDVVCCWWSLL